MRKEFVVQDLHADGWDFCDAVREATKPGKSLANTARAFEAYWGPFPDGYTLDDFKSLDRRENRKG